MSGLNFLLDATTFIPNLADFGIKSIHRLIEIGHNHSGVYHEPCFPIHLILIHSGSFNRFNPDINAENGTINGTINGTMKRGSREIQNKKGTFTGIQRFFDRIWGPQRFSSQKFKNIKFCLFFEQLVLRLTPRRSITFTITGQNVIKVVEVDG